MKSNLLFCFGLEKGKSRVKRTNLKFFLQRPLLKRSNALLLFRSFVTSNKSESLPPLSISKEQKEQFAAVALLKRPTKAKERKCEFLTLVKR